jgi:hypothetical protein
MDECACQESGHLPVVQLYGLVLTLPRTKDGDVAPRIARRKRAFALRLKRPLDASLIVRFSLPENYNFGHR